MLRSQHFDLAVPSTTTTGRATEAIFVTLRRIGLPVLALTFFWHRRSEPEDGG